jgi:hypothetical protein
MRDHRTGEVGLCISRKGSPEGGLVTLYLEGRVAAEAVAVLERECWRSLAEVSRVHLDFSGVTFIDGRGVEALKRLPAARVHVLNGPFFVDRLLYGAGER